jgi:hypothetical protein
MEVLPARDIAFPRRGVDYTVSVEEDAWMSGSGQVAISAQDYLGEMECEPEIFVYLAQFCQGYGEVRRLHLCRKPYTMRSSADHRGEIDVKLLNRMSGEKRSEDLAAPFDEQAGDAP